MSKVSGGGPFQVHLTREIDGWVVNEIMPTLSKLVDGCRWLADGQLGPFNDRLVAVAVNQTIVNLGNRMIVYRQREWHPPRRDPEDIRRWYRENLRVAKQQLAQKR